MLRMGIQSVETPSTRHPVVYGMFQGLRHRLMRNTRGMQFTRVHATPVPALGVTLEEWRHPSGALHLHLACADEHRAFTVAVRTPPADSTGLPHILEHTTLCGSVRYPVRDPFFNMLRRSLQTFMNAMTFPDLTAYPFSTQVPKDWRNLLDVYLDAVFAPRLDPLDFAQEGHRLSPTADGSGWERQGVVFNEMKGAMDSTDAQVEAVTAARLFPATIYAHNSGGDPAVIPQLTHRDLVAFHRRCYRPANALFATYGAVDIGEFHAALTPYLADPGAPLPVPARQPALPAAQEADVPVPWADGQDVEDVAATAVTWVTGDTADIDDVLDCELIDRLLLGHAGAPLRRALEGSGLGRSVGGSGFGSSYRDGQFTIELDGIDPAAYAKLPELATATLHAIAAEGILAVEIAAALHQVELARREIHGDHYPYGLELCFRLLTPWNLGSPTLPFLDQAPAIDRLKARAADPAWIGAQIRRRFLANPHRLWVRAVPDHGWHARRDAAEAAQTTAAVAALDAAGVERLRAAAADLATRQATRDDPTILPDLDLADVPRERHWVTGRADGPLTVFSAGTNGLLHLVAALPLPALSAAELDLLPLAIQCIGSLGVGDRDYAAWSAYLTATCGGLWGWSDISADPDDGTLANGLLFLEVKGLALRHSDFLPLLHAAIARIRTDEHERLAELVDQAVSRQQDRVTSSGSQLAGRAAMRGFAGAAGTAHRTAGLGRLAWLKATAERIERDGAEGLAADIAALLSRLAAVPPELALIGDAVDRDEIIAAARAAWPTAAAANGWPRLILPAPTWAGPTAFTTATAVNYCALAFPAVPIGHPDAAALSVAGRLLTHQVLHPKLREQGGAYGGGASYQGGAAAFTLTSYRDPRLEATFADMRDALRWLAACPDDPRLFKEAILGVMASLDAPGSPAGECRSRFSADRKGTGPDRLDAYRRAVLAVDGAQVRAAAGRHLPPDGGTPAVICGTDAAKRIGWDTIAI